MACYPSTGRVIMFGGNYGGDNTLDETWAYDWASNTWVNLNPKGAVPAARFLQSMDYSPSTRRVIMFGGDSGMSVGGWFDDTWAYDPVANTWTELQPTGPVPPARSLSVMIYAQVTGRLIMFGGDNQGGYLNDTWAYDPVGNTWSELKPAGTVPPARGQHSMVYDSSSGQVIMFGGSGHYGFLNDIWAYDPAANIWTEVEPSGERPYPRLDMSMVYCPSTDRVIMFGGAYEQPDGALGQLNDTWAYDPNGRAWTMLAPAGQSPSARAWHSMVYDPATGQVMMFGGGGSSGPLNDTWDYTP
jgi:N-acetylneuraminic acid mutarotase